MGMRELGVFAFSGAVIVLIVGVLQYLALRIRNTRATPPDPQIGRKFIFCHFMHLAILLLLVGLTVSSLDWSEHFFEPMVEAQQAKKEVERARERGEDALPPPNIPANLLAKPPREWFNERQRLAAGLVASGLLHISLFWSFLRFATNARQFPSVGRSFVGLRLVSCGLILMTLTTIALIGLFHKGETDYSDVSVMAGLVVVWGPAAIIHLIVLMVSRRWHREERTEANED
jgi:hypothetical protein